MRIRKLLCPIAFAAVLGFLAMPAMADSFSIGPVCGTCQGSVYTLAITSLGSGIWEAKLTIDTSGYTGGGTAIDAVAVKISSSVAVASLTDAPGDLSNWQLVSGGINAGGCSGSGSGFECADWIATGPGVSVRDGSLTWIFRLTTGALATDYSIKARYVDSSGNKVGALVSESISVPEPGTLVLLATGLLIFYPLARPLGKKR